MKTISSIPTRGSIGPHVLVIQEILASKHLPVGSLDGIAGAKFFDAIKLLQKANGLPSSGTIGPKTLGLLDVEVVAVTPTGWVPLTSRLKKKSGGRDLHPTLRVLIEQKVFPGRVVPSAFKSRDVKTMVVSVARAIDSLNIRESNGKNYGEHVGMIQGIIGPDKNNGTGDAWCMSTDQCIAAFIEDYLQVQSPLPAGENCVDVYKSASKISGLVSKRPEIATFYIGEHQKKPGTGHTGTVLGIVNATTILTFEGNRSNRAFIANHTVPKSGDLLILGYVRLYPNNRVA